MFAFASIDRFYPRPYRTGSVGDAAKQEDANDQPLRGNRGFRGGRGRGRRQNYGPKPEKFVSMVFDKGTLSFFFQCG